MRLVNAEGSVTVQDLSRRYHVSGTTIRLDLTALEQAGLLQRTHGGAVKNLEMLPVEKEPRMDERSHFEEKRRIAAAALSLVHENEAILIDTGTTTTCFAELLSKSAIPGLTVYTTDLLVAARMEQKDHCELRMIGGSVRSGFHYTYGQAVLDELSRYHFKKVFLATSAVDSQGCTTANSDLVLTKKAMIQAADEVILLADSSKFGFVDFERFADLSQLDVVITDSNLKKEYQDYFSDTLNDLILA